MSGFGTVPRFTPFGASSNPMQSNYSLLEKADPAFVYNRIHNLKTQMPQDVLDLFKANQIAFIAPIVKKKCRKLDPVCLNGSESIIRKFDNNEMIVEENNNVKDDGSRVRSHVKEVKSLNKKRQLEEKTELWNPFQDGKAISDPYKTLVVSRLNYATTQKGLKHEFERYGAVKSVRIIKDNDGQSNGYGFVEFEKKQDFDYAYKNGEQKRLDGRRIVVDFEKGRTLLNWRPRRLGGGQGQLRLTPFERKVKEKQRAIQQELRKIRNKSRERSRQERRKKERSREREEKEKRDRQREKERQKEKERQREREKQREQRALRREKEEKEDREREKEKDKDRDRQKEKQRERHKQRKEKDRSKSKKKEKKDKKDKKEKRDHISTKQVPVEEFIK